jgi:hypothetical protein
MNKFLMQIAVWLLALNVTAQVHPYAYKFVFRGVTYQTNGTGDIFTTPLTEQTFLQDRAPGLGITNLSSIAIIYHLNGDDQGNDTVEVVSTNGGPRLALELAFLFGSDTNLGRGGLELTNATQTEIRRFDNVYTFENSTYTSPNSAAVGGVDTTKRLLTDTSGNTHWTIDGELAWTVIPQNGRGSMLCTGHFTLGPPMFSN